MKTANRLRGFTLVELLVVIGIIAVLAGLLLPALGRAREQTNRIICLSNLRQLTAAMLMYTAENKGRFPGPAHAVLPDDWVYWEAGRDPNEGALVRYQERVFNNKLYMCPSDHADYHLTSYKLSYTVNWNICVSDRSPGKQFAITKILRPTDKILFIDESAETSDDGCWAPQHWFDDDKNMLSNRHYRNREVEQTNDPEYVLRGGRGNVAFVDGHCDLIDRASALDESFYLPLMP